MTWDLHNYRLVTVSAYPGMMAPLTTHPSTVCVLSGDADNGGGLPATVVAQSLEGLGGIRRRWRYGDVAGLADFVPKVLSDALPDPRPILLISPRVNAAWEAAAATWPADMRPIGQLPSEVARVAEDKGFVREQLDSLGVPVPTAAMFATEEIQYGRLADTVGHRFVLQSPNSAGGQGTYLIRDADELQAALAGRSDVRSWLASSYAGDVTINVAGIVYADGYHLLPASTQASNIASLGSGFGAYCGTDFAAPGRLGPTVLAAAYRYTALIGAWLQSIGHRGMFGADIAVCGDELAFLEVNPRIQGSSWLLDKLLRQRGYDGCLEQHVTALLGRPAPASLPTPVADIGAGSHVLLRWTGRTGVVRAVPAGGRVPLDSNTVAVTGLPNVGTVLVPGAIVARFESDGALTMPSGTELTPAAARLISEVEGALEVVHPV